MKPLTPSQVFSLSLSLLGILALLVVVVLIDANLQAMPPLQAQAKGFDALAHLMFGAGEEVSTTIAVAAVQ
jgi:hypothetical protein